MISVVFSELFYFWSLFTFDLPFESISTEQNKNNSIY